MKIIQIYHDINVINARRRRKEEREREREREKKRKRKRCVVGWMMM